MTTTDENPQLRRIRGLLAQAEDPAATPAEAEAFAAKAESLMLKYAIDAAMLEHGTTDKGKPTSKILDLGTYATPKATLLTYLGQAFGVQAALDRRIKGKPQMILAGFEADLLAVETLYTSLLLQGANALARDHRTGRGFRHGFWLGFANTAGSRVVVERKEQVAATTAAPGAPGAALVLADRSKEVAAWARTEFGPTSKMSVSSTNGAGARAGRVAGERADLGRTRVGDSRRALSA